MFEAHSFSVSELLHGKPVNALPAQTIHRRHGESLKPLKLWFVEGRIKPTGEPVCRAVYLYVEYQDDQFQRRSKTLKYRYPQRLTQQHLDRYIQDAVELVLD